MDGRHARQVLFYAVELQELAAVAGSSVFNYNTQHSEQRELITVLLSDQGSQGAEGISEIAQACMTLQTC